MAWDDFLKAEAWRNAMANLLKKGEEVGSYIEQAPGKAGQAILEGHQKNQELWAKAHANPQRPFQVTDQNAFNELNDRYLGGVLSFAPLGITAWHGSPYRFDKFDMSKVGSGEGAQAYGHGMYFAENPNVAKTYSKMEASGATPSPRRSILGVEVDPMTAEYKAAQLVDEMGLSKAKKFVSDWVKNPVPDQVQFVNDVNKSISNITKKSQVKNLGTENLYKVDIPDEHILTMMDWDKPLGEQSDFVKKAINNLKKQVTPEMKMELGGDLNLLFGKDITPNQFLNTWEIIHPTGGTGIGEKLLNEQGVKGIRYLDNASRDAGKGTSNFVVFDPTDVKILERNNQPLTRKELLEEQVNKLK